MKEKREKDGTFTLSEISQTQFDVLFQILNTANDRCFNEQEESGDWYSNDDFVVSLTDEERQALREICKVL